jgi:1-acyl-sn-glycerol-3-phosphate acyltransferase
VSNARQWLASIACTLYLFISVPVYAVGVVAAAMGGRLAAYRVAQAWVASVLWLLRHLCRLDHRVTGLEHLPAGPAVVLVKHSSTWETLAQVLLLPRQTWVIKRELVWAPVLGWVLPLFKPIAIDRQGGRAAVEQVVAQGRERLREGLWVVIFPEGTRVPAGQTRRFGLSGTLLAIESGRPLIPIAHDAGYYWPRRGWLKRPGTIDVVIGPALDTSSRDARAVADQAQAWIEAALTALERKRSRNTAAGPGESR